MRIRLLLSLMPICLFAAPAAADEWQGGVAGVTAGYVWSEVESSSFSITALPFGPVINDINQGGGPSVGAIAGYRWTIGNLVAGAEIDADWTNASADRNSPAAQLTNKVRWQGSARAILGVPAGKALIFATGGIGAAKVDHTASFGLGAPLFRWSRTPTGWVAGGGVELNLGKIRPRLDYRHSDYGQTSTLLNSVVYFNRDTKSDSVRLSALLAF
jgi:opacity protein-like surface antigen